ncbi:7271_t:CDS:2, partial [Ambispora gerdemannii]
HSQINKVSTRYGHTANYISSRNKIYCIGGKTEQDTITSDVLSLELASSLAIESASFENLTISGKVIPSLAWAASAANKTHLFLYGGVKFDEMQNFELSHDIYALNVAGYQWKTLKTSDFDTNEPLPRRGISMVLDTSNRLYIFGGSTDSEDSQNLTAIVDNNMYILNTGSMIWKSVLPNPQLLPPNRYDYSATLLDVYIVYVGGKTGVGSFIRMNEIWIFDTSNSQWTLASATNSQNVPSRAGHTAVKLNNGPNKILVYGGYNTSSAEITSNNAIAILSTSDFKTFIWSIPSITFQDPYLQNLSIPYWHSATTYGNYMIVTFGKLPPDALSKLQSNNTYNNPRYPLILILNATNDVSVQWMSSSGNRPLPFVPPSDNPTGNPAKNETKDSDTNTSDQHDERNDNTKTIIGIIIGGVLCVAFILFLLLKVHHRAIDRKNQEERGETKLPLTQQEQEEPSSPLPEYTPRIAYHYVQPQIVQYPVSSYMQPPPGYS